MFYVITLREFSKYCSCYRAKEIADLGLRYDKSM